MTFDSAAWAINGPEIGAALARRAMYAEARQQGVVQKGDLKVTQLAVAGHGVLISAGVGLVLNGYQSTPNEMYVTNNPGTHTIPSSEMPAANASAKSYIVAVVVGDPDFSQSQHPWMPPTVPVGEETTFQYVRPTLVEVNAGATTLPTGYPALPLARIDIPADTTTILDSMIVDLRKLASPRSDQQMFVGQPWTSASPVKIPSGTSYADWGTAQYSPQVKVPSWAKRALVVCSVNGVRLADSSVNVIGNVRTKLDPASGSDVVGPATTFDIPSGTSGPQRLNLQTAGEYDVTSVAGQTVNLVVEGFENVPASPTDAQRLDLRAGSQMIFDVRFFEE